MDYRGMARQAKVEGDERRARAAYWREFEKRMAAGRSRSQAADDLRDEETARRIAVERAKDAVRAEWIA